MQPPERQPLLSTRPISNAVVFVDGEELSKQMYEIRKFVLDGTDWFNFIPMLDGRLHKALVVSYTITQFPTILLLDKYNEEVYRLEGTECLNADRLTSLVSHLEHNCYDES